MSQRAAAAEAAVVQGTGAVCGEGRGGGRPRQDGGGSDTQAVLWGHGTGSGRGPADAAGSDPSPAGLRGVGSPAFHWGVLQLLGRSSGCETLRVSCQMSLSP